MDAAKRFAIGTCADLAMGLIVCWRCFVRGLAICNKLGEALKKHEKSTIGKLQGKEHSHTFHDRLHVHLWPHDEADHV